MTGHQSPLFSGRNDRTRWNSVEGVKGKKIVVVMATFDHLQQN